MAKPDFCPECGIGINSQEKQLGFCQNCKAHWEPDDYEDEEYTDVFDEGDFEPCSGCDGHPACADFGCAIAAGIIPQPDIL